MKTNLVLLTTSYPNYIGEFFLEDEINVLSPYFNSIYIVCFHQNSNKISRVFPLNINVIDVDYSAYKLNVLDSFDRTLIKELLNNLRKIFSQNGVTIMKLIVDSFLRAMWVKKILLKQIKLKKIKTDESIFYSYWHDEKALALAKIKQLDNNIVAIARGHGWDVDYRRHTPQYLPFKHFIIKTLDQSYSISFAGKKSLLEICNDRRLDNKVLVSNLGKINNRTPLLDKEKTEFTFVSCSNIIPLKRINLIIKVLKQTKLINFKWLHWGEGYLADEIKDYATEQLPPNSFVFKGMQSNSTILDYYAQNYIDLFINLSETEGIPVSIMEAQSAGIPVLATNVGGTSEIVNNENGFLIDKDFDVNTVSKMIVTYLDSDKKNQIGKRKASYQNWNDNYNAEKNYTDFAKMILTL